MSNFPNFSSSKQAALLGPIKFGKMLIYSLTRKLAKIIGDRKFRKIIKKMKIKFRKIIKKMPKNTEKRAKFAIKGEEG